MHVAVVLRLLPEALAQGLVVGHVELVDTGERKPIRSAQELIDVLCEPPTNRVAVADPGPAPTTTISPTPPSAPVTNKGDTR
jgi:hypothetical protein